MRALFSFIRNRRNRLSSSCSGPTAATWNPASPSHRAHLGVLLCERRKPDGLFTFNKIILEEIVISQRNFLASSAILASTLTQEAWGPGAHSLRRGRRDLDEGVKESAVRAWAAATPSAEGASHGTWAHIPALPVTPRNLAQAP